MKFENDFNLEFDSLNSSPRKVRNPLKKSKLLKKTISDLAFNSQLKQRSQIDELFENAIKILKKYTVNRGPNDIQSLISYFPYLPALNKMILKVNGDKSYDIIYKLAKNLDYQYYSKNKLLMRIGDIGKYFYIILRGSVDVLVLKMKNKNLFVNEYYRYLGLLIGYNEIEILNKVINDNLEIIPIEIDDDVEFGKITKSINIKDEKKIIKKIKIDTLFSYFDEDEKKKIISYGYVQYNTHGQIIFKPPINIQSKDDNYKMILNKINTSMKIINPQLHRKTLNDSQNLSILSQKTFETINSINDNNNDNKNNIKEIKENSNENILTSEIYIQRLQTYKINKLEENNNENIDMKINVNIYEYVNLQSLGNGQYFGDFPSNEPLEKRKISIITTSECHFGILKKRNYIDILKESVEKNKKGYMIYIISTFIFKNFSVRLMQNRFFQNFVILSSKKGEYILQQMEKNDKIILIKQGTYEIGLKTSLKEIPQIIHFFYKKIRLNENEIKNLTIDNNCKYNNNKFEHSNESIYIFHTIEILRKKILDMLKEDKQFENISKELVSIQQLYNMKFDTVITIINSNNIFGFDDMDYENGLNLFYIKCTSDGEYLTLDKEIYPIICKAEESVKENEIKFVRLEIAKIISRLLEIRKIKLSTFSEMNPQYKSVIDNKESKDLYNFLEQKRIDKIHSLRLISSKNTKTNFFKINSNLILKKSAKKRQKMKNITNISGKENDTHFIHSLNLSPSKSNSFSQSINSKKLFNKRLSQKRLLNNNKTNYKNIKLSSNSLKKKIFKKTVSSNDILDSSEQHILNNNSPEIKNKSKFSTRNNISKEMQKTKSYADLQINNSIDFEKINKHFLVNMTPYINKLRIRSNSSLLGQMKIPFVDMYDNRLNRHCLYIEKRNKYNIKSTRDFFMRYRQQLEFKKIK